MTCQRVAMEAAERRIRPTSGPGAALSISLSCLYSCQAAKALLVLHEEIESALRLFRVSDLGQHAADEREQFVDGLKSRGLVRGDVLDLALHAPGLDLGGLSKLDDERRLGLPS